MAANFNNRAVTICFSSVEQCLIRIEKPKILVERRTKTAGKE
jgi:hypothetical protein